jgi:hypothetical protein
MTNNNKIASALHETLISPNELDSNLEAANVVDGLFAIARAIHHLAEAVEHTGPALDASSNPLERAADALSNSARSRLVRS